MDTFREQMCAAIPRATAALSLSLIVVAILVRVLKPPSPRWQRLAWLLVLLQGIVFLRFSFAIPCLPPEAALSTNPLPTPAPPTTTRPRTFSPPASVRSAVPLPTEANAEPTDWRRVAFNAWLGGCGAVLGWWCVLYLIVLRESARAAAAPAAWTNEWTALLSEMGLRNRIPLQVTQNVGPLLCRGLRGYRVLVPHALWESLTSEERSAVLRHELAHFRRADPWQSLLIHLLALPHWFNPLAWFVMRKLDECAEWLCDDAATRSDHHSAEVFAQVLLRLGAEKQTQWIRMPGAAMRGGRLHGRIRRLLQPVSRKRTTLKGFVLAMTACGLLAAHMVRLDLVAAEKVDANEPTKEAAAAKQPVAAKQSTLERILANWKARQERVRTLHANWNTIFESGIRFQRECWLDSTNRVWAARSVSRPSAGKAATSWAAPSISIIEAANSVYIDPQIKAGDPLLATVSKKADRWFMYIPKALLFAFRPFDHGPNGWRPEQFRLVTENALIDSDKSRYVKLERSNGRRRFVEIVWVDPSRDDVVVRWEERFQGRRWQWLSIDYRRRGGDWCPYSWTAGQPDASGRAADVRINERVPPEIFSPKFPSGTLVFDKDAIEQYRVGADGRKIAVVRLSAAELAIAKVLETYTDFAVDPQPLKDALQYIGERYQIPVLIDEKGLQAAAINPSSEVKVESAGIKVRDLLTKLLEEHPAAHFEIKDGALVLTAKMIK